jgi:hypothetical protein
MLDTEAALARALERAGLPPDGPGAAVTAAAQTGGFDADELGRLAASAGNPVPALVRALTAKVPAEAAARPTPALGRQAAHDLARCRDTSFMTEAESGRMKVRCPAGHRSHRVRRLSWQNRVRRLGTKVSLPRLAASLKSVAITTSV